MKRKEILEKRLNRLKNKLESLTKKANSSEDVNEIRSLTEQVADIKEDMAEIREELEAIEAESANENHEGEEKRSEVPEDAKLVNGNVVGSFKTEKRDENKLESMEYRSAFMNYVQKGTPIPAEYRAEGAISTDDTGVAIPITVMNEVINTVRKRYGNLYSKVRKMNVPGGVSIAIGSLEASFKWIGESNVSPRQKTDKLGKITFQYNTAEIRVAQTFLSQILTVPAFEAELVNIIARAYLEAMDKGIVIGSGDGCMTGILNDERITKEIKMSAADMGDWTKWRTKFFSKLPLGYRSGEFIFPLSTVETYLETMADSNNNPIFTQATGLVVNDSDEINPNGRFFGRDISLVEPDVIADFDSASKGDVIGIFWQPNEYAINENFGFTMMRYFDQETNEWIDKALTVVDGKVLNPTGFYKIVKD